MRIIVCFRDWSNMKFNGMTYKKPYSIKMPLPVKLTAVGFWR